MLDELSITVIAGAGGNGAISFRRERYVPRGGPDGGDGGNGGDVIIRADSALRGLDSLRRRRTVRAEAGGNGEGGKRHGRRGRAVTVAVPVGTICWRQLASGEEQVADLQQPGQRVVVARGGEGGKGNARLATSTRQTPRIAERGLAGERANIRLELRLLAEVGLVGLPNAGKTLLLRALTSARPKVGAYPFTTLEPNVGVAEHGYDTFVVADIPGLIEGAAEGAGLGIRFLQHIRRTKLLVQVIDGTEPDPGAAIETVRTEMQAFGHGLCDKPWLVAVNKIDLLEKERVDDACEELRGHGVTAYPVSAQTGHGVEGLLAAIAAQVREERERKAGLSGDAVVPVIRPPRPLEVRREAGGFRVVGNAPERAVLKLGVESEEARVELGRRLRRMGVLAALRRTGAKPGDTVRIGKEELAWLL